MSVLVFRPVAGRGQRVGQCCEHLARALDTVGRLRRFELWGGFAVRREHDAHARAAVRPALDEKDAAVQLRDAARDIEAQPQTAARRARFLRVGGEGKGIRQILGRDAVPVIVDREGDPAVALAERDRDFAARLRVLQAVGGEV